ncbi:olfactory receptor 52N4-like [Mauremys reevesii]|uniref:olfactory receptor 52N4-like n=1 Tax=Mauremys reevesii TaxID=260615 RepID=UPI00193FC945|nr:olfactory receptor 52N4-like [Mauremys reevesii]
MYYFLCMLAITDLSLSTSILPKMLSIFWFNSREIDFSACLIQIHSTILTNRVVVRIGLALVLRGCLLILPYPLLASRWPYCKTNIIPHTYCKHISVVNLACTDILLSTNYSLSVTVFAPGMDVFFIAVSYILILRAIYSLPTKEARLKTFETCSSHLCAVFTSYITFVFSFVMHRFDNTMPLYLLILVANVYLLVPSMLHPIIYGKSF